MDISEAHNFVVFIVSTVITHTCTQFIGHTQDMVQSRFTTACITEGVKSIYFLKAEGPREIQLTPDVTI